MQEQSAGNNQVIESIEKVKESMQSLSANSEELLSGGKKLAEKMEGLGKSAMDMNDAVSQMLNETGAIHESISAVRSLSDKNKMDSEKLAESLGQFKL